MSRWSQVSTPREWHLDPSNRLATIDMGRKLGTMPPFWGGDLGPHLVQCGLGRGLPPYQVTSWSMQPFCNNRHGLKIGSCAPLGGGELGPHLTQCGQVWLSEAYPHAKFYLDPSNCLATIHQCHKRRRSSSIGRTVLQTVAQKHSNMAIFGEQLGPNSAENTPPTISSWMWCGQGR